MVILNIADPLTPVSLDATGNAEQRVAALDAALIQAGHKSIVIACNGSEVAGVLVPLPRVNGHLSGERVAEANAAARRTIMRVLREYPVDCVHLHGVNFMHYLPDTDLPVFVTFQSALAVHKHHLAELVHRKIEMICVSNDQRRRYAEDEVRLDVILDGVDIQRFAPLSAKDDYVAMLGRIYPAKGFDVGLRAARSAHTPVRLAGQVLPYPDDEAYFDTTILPLLNDERRFIGPVGGAQKRELMARARAVLSPAQTEAVSSRIVMEAIACGTPVIATPRGVLAELVENGVTGWLASDIDSIRAALERADEISPLACRAAAEERFDGRRMTRAYLARYERACAGRPQGRDVLRRQRAILSVRH
jgi:glycosyltransferase involved in cell wall biosynthesis